MAGFQTYVAWRYLMARQHRVSIAVKIVLLVGLALGGIALVAEHTVLLHNWFDFNDDQQLLFAHLLTGFIIGGFVLAFLAIFFGALRYVFTFFTTVPLGGVWIGTAALVCVLSVMSGFESDLREKILGSNAHIQITREDGEELTDWRATEARVDAIHGVVASTPYAMSEVVIAANNNGMNVIIKGIDPKTVGLVTELVKDLDDRDAITGLAPLDDDTSARVVPQVPRPAGTVDPLPADMPSGTDPIDFSAGAVKAPLTLPPIPSVLPGDHDEDGSAAGSAGSGSAAGSAKFGGDAPKILDLTADAHGKISDPAPTDMITSDAPPVDFSAGSGGSDGAGSDVAIKVIDLPSDPLVERTRSLPGILVGRELVKQTHLYPTQEVRVVSPLSDPSNPDATGTPIPFNRDYRVAGVFFTGMYEYDLKYVYVSLESLQDFLDRGDTIDGIEVRIGDPDDTDEYVKKIGDTLGPQYRVQDWKELNRSLFSALKLEKIAMFLVLGIVILVASFSIVGNLIMVVVEKAREIALLKTLGASDFGVMQLFAIQGLLIGVIGTVLGVGIGLCACWAGQKWGLPLNPEVYYIDRLPIHIEPASVAASAAAGILISIAATLYPALLAARVRPAAGMRH